MNAILGILYFSVFPGLLAAAEHYCKPAPNSARWPSPSAWQALNESVSGHLVAPTPPGAVCHPNSTQYDAGSCALVQSQWTNATWHAAEPVTADYNDETCPPDAKAPCSGAGYPVYVVEADCAHDVQQAVEFAEQTGIRLVVKGTGHDWPGRSSGPQSLSIWTHNIRGISVTQGDPRAVSYGGVASITIAAGERMIDVYTAAAANNITVVGGSDLHVGIGGWTTGGGHSPLSSKYGLGADQVLEMEVVTANGQLLKLNEHDHSDLFWAMRGGGGSTFAVMVSVTVKAYPKQSGTIVSYSYNTTADSDTFWSMVALGNSFVPQLSESGVMGYYFVYPNDTAESKENIRGKFFGTWIVPEKKSADAMAILKPLNDAISQGQWSDKVYMDSEPIPYPDFSSAWLQNTPQTVGPSGRLGSRLLDWEALTGDLSKLKAALKQATPQPNLLLGHIVAGKGVRDAVIPGGSNAVNPAWRKAYNHVVLPRAFIPLNATDKAAVTEDLRQVRVKALHDLAPNSGAYMSEADPTEPNWQHTFWGSNYPRLLRIKQKWDPRGVFWCIPCVGHELWSVTGGDGIGQDGGTICRL